jgi:hypothetical protein
MLCPLDSDAEPGVPVALVGDWVDGLELGPSGPDSGVIRGHCR